MDRATTLRQIQDELDKLDGQERDDLKATQKAVGEAKLAKTRQKEPVYTDFEVRWKKDGKIDKLKTAGPLTLDDLLACIRGVGQACEQKLRSERPAPGHKGPAALKQAFRRRSEARATRRYRLEELRASVEQGSPEDAQAVLRDDWMSVG